MSDKNSGHVTLAMGAGGKQTAELGKALYLVNLLGLDVEFRKRDQSGG